MKKEWFKAKEYGWGWYPCSWEGWVSLVVFLLFVAAAYWYFLHSFLGSPDRNPPGINLALIKFFGTEVIMIGLFCALAYKTGEKPGWRWGKKKTGEKK